MSETPEKPAALDTVQDEADALVARPVRSVAQTQRAARLATALRDNLRRRKAVRPLTRPSGN